MIVAAIFGTTFLQVLRGKQFAPRLELKKTNTKIDPTANTTKLKGQGFLFDLYSLH